jgi:hypothetical protein
VVQGQTRQKHRPYLKNKLIIKRTGGMAQVVECSSSKHEAPLLPKKRKKASKQEREITAKWYTPIIPTLGD